MVSQQILCLEGIVGSGKTTQIEMLQRYLINSYLIPELNQFSPHKEIIEKWREKARIRGFYHLKEDIVELAKSRAETQKRLLQKAKDANYVLLDRGIYTCMVFESGLVEMNEIKQINLDTGVIVPDIVIVLECDPNEALKRVDFRRVAVGKYTSRAYHESFERITKYRDLYRQLAKKENLHLINSSSDPNQTFKKILGVLGL